MRLRILLVLAALALVVAVPFLLKPQQNLLANADNALVIISPHNEAVRHEFTTAFVNHYKIKTGRSIRIDWRLPGGTSEISRFLAGEYLAAFQYAWTLQGKRWTTEVASAFDDSKIKLPDDPFTDTPVQAARRSFLNSTTGIG
ncbi:MAG: iron ABC transporter substrate-binding protein, partial [Verrucomicrobia bacterium]|nr:iron ABC transporter substrate-binding protein [Verrucomicrobiota bacterium]